MNQESFIFITQILEILFFSFLFLINKKCNNNFLFYICNILQYFIFKKIFSYNIITQILLMIYPVISIFLINKKNKNTIIDIMIINFGILFCFIITIPFLLIGTIFDKIIICSLINKIFCLILLFIFKNKFIILYDFYIHWWNHKNDEDKPIISLSLRNISLVIMNILLIIGNIILFR